MTKGPERVKTIPAAAPHIGLSAKGGRDLGPKTRHCELHMAFLRRVFYNVVAAWSCASRAIPRPQD